MSEEVLPPSSLAEAPPMIVEEAASDLDSPLHYALSYAAIGWHVFPVWGADDAGNCRCRREGCGSPAKHPVDWLVPRGQDNATTDHDVIRQWWGLMPTAGVAVFLRPSGLVAVDIDPRNGGFESMDDLEARNGRLFSDVLQYTQGGGEHRVFKLAGDVHLPGKLGPGIDLKRNGYIVLAPTKGCKGVYSWEASSSPLEQNIPSPLPDWIRDLGKPVAESMTVTTTASRYVTEAQVVELRDALAFIPADDRDEWVRFGLALAPLGQQGFNLWDGWSQKSKKYNPVDAIRVWRSLKPGAVNFESIFFEAEKHGWINPLRGFAPSIVVHAAPPPVEVAPEPVTPEELLTIPVAGLQEAVTWMEGFSEEPNRQISIQGALALCSVLAGRIYESENGNTSSMYFLTLAGTGVGKGYPKAAIHKLLTAAGLGKLLSGSGNTSAGSVFSALFKSPTHIQITDEFGKHLSAARKQMTGAMAQAFAVMTEAYSDTTGVLVPQNYSHFQLSKKEVSMQDSKSVHRPAITLFAFATPEQVLDTLSTGDIDDGFLNRIVAVECVIPSMPEQRLGNRAVPESLIALARAMRRVDTPLVGVNLTGMDCDYDMAPSPVMVQFAPNARDLFDAFKKEIKATTYDEPRLVMRWRENAMRLATGLAVADNPMDPIVSESLAQWAINYVRHYGLSFINTAITHIADNDFHRIYLLVRNYVEKAGARGVTEGDLSDMSRLFRRSPPQMRNQAFDALIREKKAAMVTFATPSGRGRPRQALVGMAFIPESND